MSTPARCRNWVVIVPLAAIAAAYVYLVFLPNRRAVAELRGRIKTKQEVVAGAEATLTSLGQARQELKRTKDYLAARRQRMAEEKDLGAVLGKIHELVNDAQIRITRFDPQQAVVYEQFRRVPCLVGCTGSFAKIYEFLRKLESLPTTVWVSSMRLEKDAKAAGSEGSVQCDIVLAIFAANSDNSDYARRSE
jgi:type IV pilus assembly protein PilO